MNDSIDRLAPLLEPARRRVFSFVAAADSPVTREQTAAGTGLSSALATFHLEKLLEAGLVEASFSAAEGGRRRGRPAKLYRPLREELIVSVPGSRDYRLAAELFAEALPADELPPALDAAARERGRAMGRGIQDMAGLVKVLADQGYEPRALGGDSIALRNCPFQGLTEHHQALVCPTNLALLAGLVEGAGLPGIEARLEPGEGRCCVLLRAVEES